MDFSQVKKWIIPEGEVKKVVNVLDSSVLWQAIQRVLKEWRGFSPLTCTPTVADEFENIRIYGDSKQETNVIDISTLEFSNGFVDPTGSYPTQNSSFPNSKYSEVFLNTGDRIDIKYTKNCRLRYGTTKGIASGNTVNGDTTIYTSTISGGTGKEEDGYVIAKVPMYVLLLNLSLSDAEFFTGTITHTTPTPQTPIEVESVGDRTINLFDKATAETGGYIQANGEWATGSNTKRMYYLEIPQGITQISRYTFNWESSNANYLTRIGFYNENKENISVATNFGAHEKDTIIIPTGAKYIQCSIGNKDVENSVIYWGDETITDYVPYGYQIPVVVGDTTTNIYLNEPLRKIGEYADTLSVTGNEVTVVRNVVQTNLSTIGGWQKYATYGTATRFNNNNITIPNFEDRYYCKSNKYIKIQAGKANEEGFDFHGTVLYLILQSNQFTTVNELTAGLVDAYIVTPLSTPTTETYTIETPINAVDNTTVINIDTVIPPSEIYASEWVEE